MNCLLTGVIGNSIGSGDCPAEVPTSWQGSLEKNWFLVLPMVDWRVVLLL